MKSITTKPRFAITHSDAGPLLLPLIPGWAPMRACIWALAVVLALWWTTAHIRRTVKDMARIGARSCFEKDLLYRQGADMKGGVYVPTTGKTPLNRYLVHLPDRDITTRSGHPLTLMNPAHMIRQVHELGKELYEHRDHINSLKPIRPENDPVAWESKALEAFERGAAKVSSVELIEGQPHLRLMQPTKTMARCLKCYSVQGYQEGGIRGGISVAVPMKYNEAIFHFYQREELRAQSGIGVLALLSLGAGHWKIRRRRRELDQAQAALRESEQRYRTLVEDSFDGIFLQKGTKIIFANKPLHEMLGYEPGELIGKDHWIIYHPEDQPMTRARAQARLRGESAIDHYEVRLQSKAGTVLDGEIRAKTFSFEEEPGIRVWVRDVTDRKKAEARLAESERKYRELVEHANSIILRWTRDGKITFLNEFGQKFFGYSSEEIVGRHVIGTIVPVTDSSGDDLGPLMDQILADPKAFERNVNENMRRSGERVVIAWTNRIVLDERGNIAEVLSIGTDITELKRAQEEINEASHRNAVELERVVAERTRELAHAKERAEAADNIKSAFLATMSHELRTPLNSIIGFTGIILQGLAGPLNPEQAKQLEMVRSSSRHLLALINDVLDISKIEAGQFDIASERFDLRSSINKVVGIVAPLAEKKGLALRANIVPGLGEAVGDQRRVEQILLNLLNNAVKFTDLGEVSLKVELVPDFKSPGGTSGQPAVRLSVSDTGIGIKPDDLTTLFQPFRQIESGLSRNYEGTGLGLAICRRLADLMGGDIIAESTWAKGSTFSFILPLKGSGKS